MKQGNHFDKEPYISADMWPELLQEGPGRTWSGEVTYLHPRPSEPHGVFSGYWCTGYLSSLSLFNLPDTTSVIGYAVRGVRQDVDIPLRHIRLDCRSAAVRDHLLRAGMHRLSGHFPDSCPSLRRDIESWLLDDYYVVQMTPQDPTSGASQVYALVHALANQKAS